MQRRGWNRVLYCFRKELFTASKSSISGIPPRTSASCCHPTADNFRRSQKLCILLSDLVKHNNVQLKATFTGYMIAAAIGLGAVSANMTVALSEGNHNPESNSINSEPSTMDIEMLVRSERMKLEERLDKLGQESSAFPSFTVAVKGKQVAIRFKLPPACDLYQLTLDVVANLGLKSHESDAGSEMKLHVWDSAVARQSILTRPIHPASSSVKKIQSDHRVEKPKEIPIERESDEDNVSVCIFEPLINSGNAEIEFLKRGSFSVKEIDAMIAALKAAKPNSSINRYTKKRQLDGIKQRNQNEGMPNMSSYGRLVKELEEMGVKIYGLKDHGESMPGTEVSWENIAGYHEQKREIEDTILLALRCPEIYDNIAKATRLKFESNRPRAVLFEGPAGTGKTSCARVIANQAGIPLLYVPLEVIMSKYYGESERLLGSIFNIANEFPDGAIIFLDEIDSFAVTRGSETHEATRRILSVLLRQIDGFEQEKKLVVIGATNRKNDLDPALLSRFDLSIKFDLPDEPTRQEIAAQYARHLSSKDLEALAQSTEGMSGRDLKDICQQAERQWASKVIRGQVTERSIDHLPPIHEYLQAAYKRQGSLKCHNEEQHNLLRNDVLQQPRSKGILV